MLKVVCWRRRGWQNYYYMPSFKLMWLALKKTKWLRFAFCKDIGKGRIQEFQNRGRGPGAVEFLGSEVRFDAPFTNTLCFVVTVENKVHIVNTVWWLQLKYNHVYAWYTVKIYKLIQPPQKFQTKGPASGAWLIAWKLITSGAWDH